MTQHQILHKPNGLPWWHKPSLWQQWRHKTMAKRFWPPIPLCATVSTLSHDSALNSPQTQWVAMVAQAVAMATWTSCFVQKPWPSDFDPLFPFVPPFQHCHMTQHRIPHKPSGLPWWHKPSLWQQWRHQTMAKRFWPPIPLCATVSTLSHDSASNSPQTQWVAMVAQAVAMATVTSCFVQKTMAKRFWPPIPLCATVSTLSHDSASNSPQTQWVAMVAQAVAMATWTSCFVQKPWPNDFDPLFPFVPPFQHCHMTQHRILHKPSG